MQWKVLLVIYSAFLLVIFLLAYLGLIPTEIKTVPFYDSIGHFVLYGILGYLSARVFNEPLMVNKLAVQSGILIVIGVVILEEYLQSFSVVRTFSFF
jgi:VanZ family protein